MPGEKYNSIKRPKVYEALKRKGYTKAKSARIANSSDAKSMFDALTTTREVPREVKAMPAELQKVWTIAFTRALSEDPEAMAADLAMAKVKSLYQQKGDTWIPKKGNEYDPATDPESDEYNPALDPDSPEYDPEAAEAAEAEGEIDPETGEPVDPIMADPYAEPGEKGEADPLMADPYGEEGNEKTQEQAEIDPDEEDDDPTGGAETEAVQAEELAAMLRSRAKYRTKYAARASKMAGDSGEFFDTISLNSKGFRMTGDGYLVANPRVARTGIQLYKGFEVGRPDMDVVRVYRSDKEVFKRDAMRSLAHRPITIDHPMTGVDASNWKELAVGKSDSDVARDGSFVRVPLVLMDSAAIKAVQSGTSQLSVGYAAKLKWGEGRTADGHKYDAMQTEIRANHIALVNAARGGDKLKIGDGRTKDGKRLHQQRRIKMERMIDGVTIELEDKDAQILDRYLSGMSTKLRDAGTDVEALKAQIAELQSKLAAAMKTSGAQDGQIAALKQEVVDSKVTPEFIDKAINARMEVIDRAATFFGDGAKYVWQGKGDAQIKRDVVTARLGDAKAKTMSDENIEGAFLSITEPELTNDFARMTQSFSRPPAPSFNDSAAKAYDKRSEDLSKRYMKNRRPFGAGAT